MDKIYVKNPNFVQREVAGEFILIPIKRNLKDSNDLFVLNEVGATVWKKIDGQRSIRDIQGDLLNEFQVSQEELSKDLNTLFQDLASIEAVHEK